MNNIPIDTQALGRMFPCICRAHKKNADKFLGNKLHHGQAKLLMSLTGMDGMSHTQIAEKLRISPAAATKVIKRMEQSGYVKRVPDEEDERVSRVYLQPEGLSLVNKIHSTFQKLDAVMFAGFSDEELRNLSDYLARIQNNLHENYSDGD